MRAIFKESQKRILEKKNLILFFKRDEKDLDKSSIDEPEDMQLARMARPLMQKGQGRPISRMGGEKMKKK